MTLTELEPGTGPSPERVPAASKQRRPARTRRPIRRLTIVTHRWLSLVIGLVLVVLTTTGALLVYKPELERFLAHGAYDSSGGPATVTLVQAMDLVNREHPGFKGNSAWAENGVYTVRNEDDAAWTVDPHTGEILGSVGTDPTWVRWVDNLHECFLSCDGEPGTVPFLTKEIPHTAWLGYDGDTPVTGGGLVLGAFGLLLLYLSLTGLWLWFPRPGKWRDSMKVRWRRGRFARDTDLHKVVGMVVLVPLLIWSVTGTGFELGFVEKAWYAVTPGHEETLPEPVSAKSSAPDITPEQAMVAAEALHPDAALVNVTLPEDDATSAYTFWFSDGFDAYGRTTYPGDLGVYVDRHTGVAKDYYGAPGESTAQNLWETWSYPLHAGYIVNGWWRILWFVLGLSPILLAVTGVSTWLVRNKNRRSRKKAARSRDAATATTATTAASEAGV